jgi:hypothetical protein
MTTLSRNADSTVGRMIRHTTDAKVRPHGGTVHLRGLYKLVRYTKQCGEHRQRDERVHCQVL